MRLGAGLLALAALAAVPLVASADDEDSRAQSREAFRRGVADVQAGDYTGARDAFAEAYRLFPHPSILLNLGIVRVRTGEYREAEEDLLHFLADYGDASASDLASARAALAEARTHLGSIRLRASPEGARARIDARPIGLMPGSFVEVRSTFGAHKLHVEADGYDPVDRNVTVEGGRSQAIDLVLKRHGAVDAAASGTRHLVGWALVGGAVAFAGFGAFAGLRARSLADDYNTAGSAHYQDPSTKSTGITFRTLADVSFLVALGAVIGGGYLLLVPATGASGAQARLMLSF
jgi:tetratricopeptide (TPR) repeat protein